MNRLEISKIKIARTIQSESLFEFPEFLNELRLSLAITRENVSQDLDIPYLKMYYLEAGNFRKPLDEELLQKLSSYYGVKPTILEKKASEFLEKGRGKRQGTKRKHR